MGDSDSLLFEFTNPPNSSYASMLITPFLWSTDEEEREQQTLVSNLPCFLLLQFTKIFHLDLHYFVPDSSKCNLTKLLTSSNLLVFIPFSMRKLLV